MLYVSTLITDDPLDGWNFLSDVRKSNYWRNWTTYVDAFMFCNVLTRDMNTGFLTRVLKFMPSKLNLHKFIRKNVILNWNEEEFLENPYVTNISSLVHLVQVAHAVKCKDFQEKIITFTWNLYLNNKIRTKFIFSKFKIFSTQFLMCQNNITILLEPERNSVSFCGIYNNYAYYSPRNVMLLHYGPVRLFSLSVIFDIISANVITTTEINENTPAATLIKRTYTNVQVLNLKVITFHIVAEKFKQISITIGSKFTVCFIDGPGFMSKKFKFDKANVTFKSSTFQCIVQIKAEDSFPLTALIGEFTVKSRTNYIKLHADKTITKEYSCNSSVCVQKVIINSPKNTHIKLTMAQFLFTREEVRGCQYGGVSFYNIYGSTYTEIKSVCSTYNSDSRNLQTIYSDQRKLLMVFFSCKRYSSLSFVTEVSHTICLPIRHNICSPYFGEKQQKQDIPLYTAFKPKITEQIFEININNLSCAIFQIYRGILDCGKQHPHELSFCYMDLFVKKVNGFIRHRQWYHYKINGYFSDVSEKYSCWDSYVFIRGEYFRHDKKNDIKMSTWKNGNERFLNYSQYSYVYNTSQVCDIVCPVLSIVRNQNEIKALKYSFNYYTLIPTIDKSLRFRFKLSSQADWIDLVFKPFTSESNSKENTQLITNVPVQLVHQYNDQILLLRVDPKTLWNDSVHLVVDVRMKVRNV